VITGSEPIIQLVDLEDPDAAWSVAARDHREVVVAREDMDEDLAARVGDRKLGTCWLLPIDDPMHDDAAVIAMWSRADGPDIEAHRYAVEMMSRALSLVLQWRHLVAGLVDAARTDPLTGLVNRTGFWEVLDSLASEHASPLVAVLYVDLDGFKAVNDEYGHRTGDAVLTEAAHRIAAVIRPGDLIARLGGDEFGVVCRDLAAPTEAVAIAERVIAAVGEPVDVSGEAIAVGASIGIATVRGHELRSDELLEAADAALYEAKRAGRGSWHLAGSSAAQDGTLDA
jgi:diguanylate cyclase (GGDEF)-like protein